MTLSEFLRQNPDSLYLNREEARFPVLVKFIDACDNLSIQVHPDDEYAFAHENDFGKMEVWYVVEAEPNASIIYGFKEKITPEQFRLAIENDTLPQYVNIVPIKKGDVIFIPAGTLHSINRGVVVVEIQQNSNTTYRVYDHGRVGADGKPRELHVDKALDVTATEPPKAAYGQPKQVNMAGMWRTPLAECSYFSTEKYDIFRGLTVGFADTFCHILVLDGEADIVYGGESIIHVKKGSSVFVPAGADTCDIKGKCSIILTKETKGGN
jgi:mannose-6-phosphate isomerase